MARIILLFFVLAWGAVAYGQQELEIIPLRHQTPDRVLPALQPLVEPGGSLSAGNNQLFLRASRRNREDIKRALAALDAPVRKLVIRVSQNRGVDEGSRGGAVAGQVTLGGSSRVDASARVWDSRSVKSEAGSQMVQTIEGGRAFIQVGRSLPLPLRQVVVGPGGAVVSESVVYRDIGQGFYAEPRLAGDRVTLEISQQADSLGGYGYGSVNTQRVATTVSGRLGEWIELGGSGRQAAGNERGTLSLSTSDVRESRSIWLMVEEVQ